MIDYKHIKLNKETLLSYYGLKRKPDKKKDAGPKRIKPLLPKERKSDGYYISVICRKYIDVFQRVFHKSPFGHPTHKNRVFGAKKTKLNFLKIANYLLELREEKAAWNPFHDLIDDYFDCIFNKFKKNMMLPKVHIVIPGPRNQETFWTWILYSEQTWGSSYFRTRWDILDTQKAIADNKKKGPPDDPWLDRCALVAGNPPTYRPNRYLLFNEDNNFVVIAEPLKAATTELVAYNNGNWLYRVIVDQSGNVVEIKETER